MALQRNDLPQYSPSPLASEDGAPPAPGDTCPRCISGDTRLLPMNPTPDWSRCVTCGHVWMAAMLQRPPDGSVNRSWTEPVAEALDLFWSRRGEVACALHSPQEGSPQWTSEQWTRVTRRKRLTYQCQHCHGNVPIARRHGRPHV